MIGPACSPFKVASLTPKLTPTGRRPGGGYLRPSRGRFGAGVVLYYAEHKATVDIRTCELIQSDLPGKQTKLVLAWAELHQEELMANWALVMNGEELFKIQPLQ